MKKIIFYVWQFPQNIFGYFISKKCKFRRKLNFHKIFEIDYGEGMSLGNYIFINPKCSEGNLIKHEFGHCIQSNILGWLYLIIIFLPSYCWWMYFSKYCKDKPDSEYYKFFTEKWADNLIKYRKK